MTRRDCNGKTIDTVSLSVRDWLIGTAYLVLQTALIVAAYYDLKTDVATQDVRITGIERRLNDSAHSRNQ